MHPNSWFVPCWDIKGPLDYNLLDLLLPAVFIVICTTRCMYVLYHLTDEGYNIKCVLQQVYVCMCLY